MKLYHGTTERALKRILKSGLTPRGKRRSVWAVASSPKAVYLTTAYGIHFGSNACPRGRGRMAIIEIDSSELEPHFMAPDEDFLEQGTRNDPAFFKQFDGMSMEERTLWFRKRLQSNFQPFWQASLEKLGNCAYFGTVPVRAITQVAVMPVDHAFCYKSDPTISLMNYAIMGPFYRNLTRAVFADYDLFEPDPLGWSAGLEDIERDGVEVQVL